MPEINTQTVLSSVSGGVLDYVSYEGEILASVAVPAGLVPAAEYLLIAPEGAQMQVSSGLVALNPRNGVGIQPYGDGSHDSGANPDFKPLGSAERLQREMVQTMRHMQASTKRLEAREAALAAVERIPSPKPAPDPVIEPIVAPAEPASVSE